MPDLSSPSHATDLGYRELGRAWASYAQCRLDALGFSSLSRLLGAVLSLRVAHAVVAKRVGLEIARGQRSRLVSWDKVWNVRELSPARPSPPWLPALWRVDLVGGESFHFVGIRRSREIVQAFWAAHRSR